MVRSLLLCSLALSATPACDSPAPITTVGPEGGTVLSDDGRLRIEVPRGALAHEVQLTIGHRDACYRVGPSGLHFEVPAHITLDAPVVHHWTVLELGDDARTDLCSHSG